MNLITMKDNSKQWMIIGSLALMKLLIHLFTSGNYELHRDALLYYSLGEKLDWGYVSVPPFTPFISAIATGIFGNTAFALRFFPALAGSIAVIVIAKIVKELKGGTLAMVIAVLAFILSPAFLRSNSLFQPVTFNQFFWLLSGYLLVKLIKTHNEKLWPWIFLVWGIAFLNKYSITFFMISAFMGLLMSRHRKMLFSKYFITGGILAVLIILPNLVWQYRHNWPVIHHMAELQESQFVNVSPLWFIVDQVTMNLPGLAVWLTGLIAVLFFKQEKEYRAMAYLFIITLVIILFLRGKSYYTLGLYPIFFAIGGYTVQKYFQPFFRYVVIAAIVLVSLPLIPFSLPVLNHDQMALYSKPTASFTNRWEDGEIHLLPQDYADMIGWKELARQLAAFYEKLPPKEKSNILLYTDNYGQAGAIRFYKSKTKLPEPISFSDNFLLWAPDSINDNPLIYVNHELGDIQHAYGSCELVGQVKNKYFREDGVKIFYCTEPRALLNVFYSDLVTKLKSKYR